MYYFLKIKKGFFKRHDIQLIDGRFKANGIKLYLWLLCESLDHAGRLRFSESEPYTVVEMAELANVDKKSAARIMDFLIDHRMVTVEEDGTFIVNTLEDYTAPETDAERQQRRRERIRHEDVTERHEVSRDVTKASQNIEYRIKNSEYRIQKEKEKDIVNTNVLKKGESIKRFAPPTLEEVQSYSSEKGYHIDCQRFIDYYESNGWKVGRNPMKDWKAAVRSWAARDKQEDTASSTSKRPDGWEAIDNLF